MKKIILLILILQIGVISFAQYTVETVPNPKQDGGAYVSNPDFVISQYVVDSLNFLINRVDTSGIAQIAVVVLNSIGDEVPKTFATDLFNYWHIGNKQTDNGLLILLVMDQHRVEFETGYGLESFLTDADCYNIQQEYMIPQFKAEDYDKGLLNGVVATISKLSSDTLLLNQLSESLYSSDQSYGYDTNNNYSYAKKQFFRSSFFKDYSFLAIFLSAIYFILLFIGLLHKDKYVSYRLIRPFTNVLILILVPVPFLLFLAFNLFILKRWRNMPRISPQGYKMRLLNEEEDNKYLEKGQVKEEVIKSIDYDVWIADESGETLVLGYVYRFSKYKKCPKCKFKTYYLKSNRIIQAATYSSSGTGQRTYTCKNCGHTVVSTYTIPKKQSTSSGSYSSFGSSSGSYSGGSSWGGGSSGGGGAGSSW